MAQGIRYEEEYPVKFSGSGNGRYMELDIANKTVTIYNKDFYLKREGVLADNVTYDSYTKWTGRKDVTRTPVFKQDYLEGINTKPRVSTNVEIIRGNAAAFEKHLKMGEVNTLEDLENYRNNEFNL